MSSERYIIGQEMLQRVDGKGGEAVVDSLRDIAPDFARYLIEFPFGDIYARPGLDLRSREIATIAAICKEAVGGNMVNRRIVNRFTV